MRHVLHRRLRSTCLTVLGALVLVGSLLSVSAAAASPVRQYVPTLSPTCAAAGSTSQFTVTISNASGSNQNLGSAILANDPRNGFSHVGSFTSLSATGGKSWAVLRDPLFGAGLLLRATSSSNALAPGQSVSVTFSAQAPSTPGVRTWRTWAFQGTFFFLSPAFALAPGASQPTVNVVSSPPCGGSVSVFCPSGGCTSGVVPAGPPGSTVKVDVPACPPGHVCDGNLTVFDNGDPNVPVTTGCPTGEGFNPVSSVTILPPPGHTAIDPPIIVTFTDTAPVTGAVCKVDTLQPDGQLLLFPCHGEIQILPPCIRSKNFGEGTSTIVVEMTSTDPIMKH